LHDGPFDVQFRVKTGIDDAVRTITARQHGMFELGQLAGLGVTRSTREYRLKAGTWLSMYDGVYRLAGVPPSWEGDVLAACWAGGPDAVASHRTAAALWNLPGRQRRPIEILCRRWRRSQSGGLLVHETTALDPRDADTIDGIPVSSVARTLLVLGAVCGRLTVEMAIDNALRRDRVALADLREVLQRLGRSGRNGAGVLRSILDERGDRAPTDSEMETLLLDVLRRNGLPAPALQFVVTDRAGFIATVDAAYPDTKVAIEYESYEHHIGRIPLVRDSARRNQLIAAGWIVITATAVDLQTGGRELCRAIRAGLERG
jgi:hypothetical protein